MACLPSCACGGIYDLRHFNGMERIFTTVHALVLAASIMQAQGSTIVSVQEGELGDKPVLALVELHDGVTARKGQD